MGVLTTLHFIVAVCPAWIDDMQTLLLDPCYFPCFRGFEFNQLRKPVAISLGWSARCDVYNSRSTTLVVDDVDWDSLRAQAIQIGLQHRTDRSLLRVHPGHARIVSISLEDEDLAR